MQVDFDGDPAEGIVPYLVELDSGGEVLAPKAQTPTSDAAFACRAGSTHVLQVENG